MENKTERGGQLSRLLKCAAMVELGKLTPAVLEVQQCEWSLLSQQGAFLCEGAIVKMWDIHH